MSLAYDLSVAREIAERCVHNGELSLTDCADVLERVRMDLWLEEEKVENPHRLSDDEALGEYLWRTSAEIAKWIHSRDLVAQDTPIRWGELIQGRKGHETVTPVPKNFPTKAIYYPLFEVVRDAYTCHGSLGVMLSRLLERSSGQSHFLYQDKNLANYLASKLATVMAHDRQLAIAVEIFQVILEGQTATEESAALTEEEILLSGGRRRRKNEAKSYELLMEKLRARFTDEQYADRTRKVNQVLTQHQVRLAMIPADAAFSKFALERPSKNSRRDVRESAT